MDQPRVENENPSHIIIDMPDGNAAAAHNNDEPSLEDYCFLTVAAFNVTLVFSSVIVLIMSRHEKPPNPLFAWIVGYTVACALRIPVRYRELYFMSRPSACSGLLECFSILLFALGNYCIFGGKSYSHAHIMYRFGVALLVFDYINYIAGAVVSICGYCGFGVVSVFEIIKWLVILLFLLIVSIVSSCFCSDGGPAASRESINAQPTYKFKLQGGGGGIVAAAGGTEKVERSLPGEDAVCCICIADYRDNDVLKELPCTHLFHASCVDKWLKIKASCPLCIRMIEKSAAATHTFQ